MKYPKSVWMIAIVGIVLTGSCQARTLYVAQSGDGTNGESWETAFVSIGHAIGAAGNTDCIWVKMGTYTETLKIESTAISLLGGFSGTEASDGAQLRDPSVNLTTIDANNSLERAILLRSHSIVDGFKIVNSRAGGFFIQNCSPLIRRCLVQENEGTIGSGAEVRSSTVEFVNCTFRNNTADGFGGGLYCAFGSHSIIESCTFENNTSGAGGGLVVGTGQHLLMNTVIRNNRSLFGEGPGGGGVRIGGNAEFVSCLIYGNTAFQGAQIEKTDSGTVEFTNCTLIGGSGEVAWIPAGVPATAPSFHNCILWGSPSLLSGEGQAEVTYSAVQGGYTGLGNISDDPLFVDPATGNFRLQPDSPCIDTAGTSGPNGDLDGNPRPVDVPGLGREGADTFDMGAYEFQPLTPTPTLTDTPIPTPTMNPGTDINRDSVVDVNDLLLLILDWQKVSGP